MKHGSLPGGPVVKTLLLMQGMWVQSLLPQGAKISYALRSKTQNIKQKQYCNKLNKDFKK